MLEQEKLVKTYEKPNYFKNLVGFYEKMEENERYKLTIKKILGKKPKIVRIFEQIQKEGLLKYPKIIKKVEIENLIERGGNEIAMWIQMPQTFAVLKFSGYKGVILSVPNSNIYYRLSVDLRGHLNIKLTLERGLIANEYVNPHQNYYTDKQCFGDALIDFRTIAESLGIEKALEMLILNLIGGDRRSPYYAADKAYQMLNYIYFNAPVLKEDSYRYVERKTIIDMLYTLFWCFAIEQGAKTDDLYHISELVGKIKDMISKRTHYYSADCECIACTTVRTFAFNYENILDGKEIEKAVYKTKEEELSELKKWIEEYTIVERVRNLLKDILLKLYAYAEENIKKDPIRSHVYVLNLFDDEYEDEEEEGFLDDDNPIYQRFVGLDDDIKQYYKTLRENKGLLEDFFRLFPIVKQVDALVGDTLKNIDEIFSTKNRFVLEKLNELERYGSKNTLKNGTIYIYDARYDFIMVRNKKTLIDYIREVNNYEKRRLDLLEFLDKEKEVEEEITDEVILKTLAKYDKMAVLLNEDKATFYTPRINKLIYFLEDVARNKGFGECDRVISFCVTFLAALYEKIDVPSEYTISRNEYKDMRMHKFLQGRIQSYTNFRVYDLYYGWRPKVDGTEIKFAENIEIKVEDDSPTEILYNYASFDKYFVRHSNVFSMDYLTSNVITIFGCGTIGSNLAFFLRKMGFVNFILIDKDTVETHNLSNQFFREAQVSLPKSNALYHTLDNTFYKWDVFVYDGFFDAVDFVGDNPIVKHTTIAVLAVDNILTRYKILQALKDVIDHDILIIDVRMNDYRNVTVYSYRLSDVDKYQQHLNVLRVIEDGKIKEIPVGETPCGLQSSLVAANQANIFVFNTLLADYNSEEIPFIQTSEKFSFDF